MNFLPDVYVRCEKCHGTRYNRETLEVRYKGKSIAEVLEMTVEEAAEFFDRQLDPPAPQDSRRRRTRLCAARPKRTNAVRRRSPARKAGHRVAKSYTGQTIYILDEPTTGLHFEDIRKLLTVINGLVDKGNTVIVIEHNLDVIKTSDWIIDMGPEGGSGGGTVVATGTPEDVAANPDSYTGHFLAETLGMARPKAKARRRTKVSA